MFSPEVWLKWWTEANDGDSSVHTGMYYGVYVAFLSARVILIGTDCWCVSFTLLPLSPSSLSSSSHILPYRFMFVVLIPQSAEWLHWKLLESTMRYVDPCTEQGRRCIDQLKSTHVLLQLCRHWRFNQQVQSRHVSGGSGPAYCCIYDSIGYVLCVQTRAPTRLIFG